MEIILREEIERGVLTPGAPLRQEDLAERFGVSRQPVRKVLERLLVSGLLERRSDRTLAVAGFTPRQAAELVDIRAALETHALTLSLPELDDAVIRKARRISEDLMEEEDPAELEELDVLFHRLLYSRCGNERLLRMIEDLRREGRRIYSLQPLGAAERKALYAEHQIILAACAAKDMAKAVEALAAHLKGTAGPISQQTGEQE